MTMDFPLLFAVSQEQAREASSLRGHTGLSRFTRASQVSKLAESPGKQTPCVRISNRDSGQRALHQSWSICRWLLAIPAALIFAAGAFAEEDPPSSEKRVEINKTEQMLRAYEGDQLVFETRISTGRRGFETPKGSYHAGVKHRYHYSKRYHNAPMPFSVQVNGHIFIHGFTEVPMWPASHGCIRVPLAGNNPAAEFFAWAEPGMPIVISGQWAGPPKPAKNTPAPKTKSR